MKKWLFLTCVSLLSIGINAATTTGSNKATATLASSCSITANTLSFGTYDPRNSAPQTAASNMLVTCSKGVSYTIGLDRYTANDPYFSPTSSSLAYGSAAPALLNQSDKVADGTIIASGTANATKALLFNIYTDSGRTRVWTGYNNHWVGVNQYISGVGTGTQQTIPFYGSLGGGQFVQPGNYASTMTTTIKF